MVLPPSNSLTVRIIRHGQTADNARHIIQGQLNTPLNDVGRSQALLLGNHIVEETSNWRAAWSSDLARAKESAEIILAVADPSSSPLQVDERLRERFMSTHQGLSFMEERGPIPEDAESMATMAARALDFWQDQIVPLAKSGEGGVMGIVSHGAFLKLLLTHLSSKQVGLLRIGKGVQVAPLPNTSVTTVVLTPDGHGTITQWGACEHLVVDEVEGGTKHSIIVGDLSGGE